MQHLQQQPHTRVHPDLLRQSRSRHPFILSLHADRFHFEIAKQPHQHTDEFDLCEFPAWAVARAAGPADERAVAGGWLF